MRGLVILSRTRSMSAYLQPETSLLIFLFKFMPHFFANFGYVLRGYWLRLLPQSFRIKELVLTRARRTWYVCHKNEFNGQTAFLDDNHFLAIGYFFDQCRKTGFRFCKVNFVHIFIP